MAPKIPVSDADELPEPPINDNGEADERNERAHIKICVFTDAPPDDAPPEATGNGSVE